MSTEASYEHLLLERREHTLLVTLNRPEVGNALNRPLMLALEALWREVATDRSVRCIVVTGAGKAFCTGADVSMLSQVPRPGGDSAAEELAFLPGRGVPQPVIVAVNGACAGGGLHFVGDADIAICARRATFVDPHVSVGQVSALEPLELVWRMRADMLRRMVLLGTYGTLDADSAFVAGLVSEVVDADDLLPTAMDLAEKIASNSPEAVRLSRRAMRTFEARLVQTDLDLGWELIRRHWQHPDAEEGPAAYFDKRPPHWHRL